MAAAGGDVRRAHDVGFLQPCVVIEGVGGEQELLVDHLHVVVEDGHLRVGVILPPVAGQRGAVVHQAPAVLEIALVPDTVVVELVGIERGGAVLQHHVVAGFHHLLVAVVVALVAGQREGVALHHAHMSPRLEGVARLEEVGAVAVEACPVVLKLHVAGQHLRAVVVPAVIEQLVGMYQIDARGVILRGSGLLLLRRCRSKGDQHAHYAQKRLHLTHPSYSNLQS